MKRSNRLILLIGVFLAALAFVIVIVVLSKPDGGGIGTGATAAPPTKVPVVVAARDIPLGVAVTSDMLTTKTIATTLELAGAYGDLSQVVGKVARANIKKDQQVTQALFNDTGVSTQVDCPAGFTCMAVQVDQVSGVGTLIKTGDYVDVIAQISPTFPLNYFLPKGTTPVSGAAGAVYDPTSVKMLIQGLQVVGTLLPPAPAPAAAVAGATPAPAAGPGTALNGQQEIVIIAVTAAQAEVVKFAQLDGNITLSLRSPIDFQDANGNRVIPSNAPTTGLVLRNIISLWGVLTPNAIVVAAPTPLP